jgi:class 3 adenylate cyclase
LRPLGGSTTLGRVERSEEIRRVMERWFVAYRDGDADEYTARISGHPGTLAIGSDEEEWLHGADLLPVWRHQLEETGGFPVEWSEIEAWEEGSVGWAACQMTIRPISGSGPESLARGSWVLHLERGEWKIVQVHYSLGVPNLEVFGVELPTSLDQIQQAMRDERPDLSGSTAADGTVTLVFTDIVDSTVLTARLGDQAWMETVRRQRDIIRETVEQHAGRVVETQGDGSLLAFASARRAVACARSIQQAIQNAFADASPPIRVRIGVHTGDVLQEADRFYGTTVNYAARVASHALGGEVLVSSLVHDLVGDSGVTYLESREVELKGLDGTHRLFAVAVS